MMAPWILPVIGLLTTAIPLVEGLLGRKRGDEKKQFATLLVQSLAFLRGISTGGQAALWQVLTPEALSPLIDQVSGLLFPTGSTVTSDEALRMVASLQNDGSQDSKILVKLDTIIAMLSERTPYISTVTEPVA